ncbi:MAG TPA: copper homeostasis protein CutC, partial [Saprospiraceae bacterium]|nr:copper homeostasis protein CutC [Saprospiraceae bacterium]
DEFILEKMISAIENFKSLSIDGFVIGLLQQDRIDREKMQKLINSALPFSVTIHKAIDLSSDPESDVKWLNQFETVDTILTSGGAVNAIDGVDQILKMKSWFKGEVMAGGKITGDILPTLHAQLGLRWYHGRNII